MNIAFGLSQIYISTDWFGRRDKNRMLQIKKDTWYPSKNEYLDLLKKGKKIIKIFVYYL